MARVVAVCGFLLLLAPRAAFAEWQLTPMFGVTFLGNTTIVDVEQATGLKHKQYGGAVDLLSNGVIGVEGITTFTPGFFENSSAVNLVQDSRAFALMGNVVVTVPRRWTEYFLRPFASAGFGVLHAAVTDKPPPNAPQTELLSTSATVAGFDIGGGAIGFLTQKTGIRLDLRYYTSLHHSQSDTLSLGAVHLRYMTFSIGVVFRK
jgi:outer membrane protein with beta-barrel domain